MFHLEATSSAQGRQEQRQGKSARYMQSQRFIPPTHPVYVVAPLFEAAHILSLQEECDRNYIAMAMQTSRKKFLKMPDMPQDRFFIIADDSAGPPLLEGEFLLLNSRVVGYPVAHSLSQVIEAFREYVGLGHFETSEQYYQNNEHSAYQQENRQATVLVKVEEEPQLNQLQTGLSTLVANLNKNDAINSVVSVCKASKIQLREVSSLKVESKLSRGTLFIYDNRKDGSEFKQLVVELRSRFSNVSSVRFIERIDEYNNEVRLSRETDNIVLMSHYSFVNLSQYFVKYRSFTLFLTESEKLDLYSQKYVALATSRRDKIFSFVEMFIQNRSRIIENDDGSKVKVASGALKQDGESADSIGLASKVKASVGPAEIQVNQKHDGRQLPGKQGQKEKQIALKNVSPVSPKGKPQIQLVRVTDLNKKSIKKLKENLKQQPIQANQKRKEPTILSKSDENNLPLTLQQPKRYIIQPEPLYKISNKIDLPLPSPQKSLKGYKIPQIKTTKAPNRPPQEQSLSKLIMKIEPNDISFENKSQSAKKSKIKRLKSSKKVIYGGEPQISAQLDDPKASELQGIQLHKSPSRRIPTTSMMGHLRMGSDEHNSRSKQRVRANHARSHSDTDNFCTKSPSIKVCAPPARESSEPNDYYSVLPEIEQKAQNHLVKEKGPPSNQQVSIRLLPSARQKPSSKEFPSERPQIQEPIGQNIMNSIRRSKQKCRHNMTQKLGKIEEENEEMMMVRKPKAHFLVKQGHEQKQKEEVDAQENVEQLALVAYPVPKDEVELHKLRNKLKVNADEYRIEATAKKSRKVLKANFIPPTFQTVIGSEIQPHFVAEAKSKGLAEENILSAGQSNINSNIDNDFDTPAMSNISSVKPKISLKPPEGQNKAKRFTFGIEDNQDYYKRGGRKKPTQGPKTPQQHPFNQKAKEDHRQFPSSIDSPARTFEIPMDEEPKTALRPNKSKSMQQVHRVFNKYKMKPAEYINSELQGKGDIPERFNSNLNDCAPSTERPGASSQLRRASNHKVGKIYSNLKCKAANSQMEGPHVRQSSLTPSRSLNSADPKVFFRKEQIIPSRVGSNYEYYKNKGIEDLIDLDRYDKIVENGVTVYRSKFPIQVSHYTPSNLTATPSTNLLNNYQAFREAPQNAPFQTPSPTEYVSNLPVAAVKTAKKRSNPTEDPYLLANTKENQRPLQSQQNKLIRSKSGAIPLVKYSPREVQKLKSPKITSRHHQKVAPRNLPKDSIGIQCESDPFNSLVNTNNQQLLGKINSQQLKGTSKLGVLEASPYNPTRKACKSTSSPIQDMLASKLSSSGSKSPALILNMQSPFRAGSKEDEASSVSSSQQSCQSITPGSNEKLILYLMEKSQSPLLFEQLSGVRERKDSLITFKNEKQLAQQLPQTIHIYDIVYVIPVEPTRAIDGLVKGHRNCYVVELAEGKTKIKGNRVMLASLEYLTDVTELLLKQATSRAVKRKARKPASPGRLEQKSFCFSPTPTYFVPSCCHSRACHCPSVPRQQYFQSDIPFK